MKKVAIITGITGQDGSHLADFLLDKDYSVYGLRRRNSQNSLGRAQHLENTIEIVDGDLTDLASLTRLVNLAKPHEFYNLAAQSDVHISFKEPTHTLQATGLGVANCLEAIRLSGFHTRFYQASSSEGFGGDPTTAPQSELTPLAPRSPYGAAKVYGYHLTKIYRDAYRIFASNGILFNHSGPRRGTNFVTRKVSMAVAKIVKGKQNYLELGNLDSARDWGYAPDYVRGMWMMLQHSGPDDFVLASGQTHTIRELCEVAFKVVDLDWKQYVKQRPDLLRPFEVEVLRGDASKAKKLLGWEPSVSFEQMIEIMVKNDISLLEN